MNTCFRYLVTLCVLLCGVLVADAQWKIEFDSTYGKGGISLDPTSSRPASSDFPIKVVIAHDGSAYTIRKAETRDTLNLVGRVLQNGRPDVVFDADGMMSLDNTLVPSSYLLGSDGALWIGAGRSGRSEMMQIDRLGRLSSTPFWQDTALFTSNKVLGLRGGDTLVMFSNRWRDPESPTFIRHVVPSGVLPASDVFVPFDPTPINVTLDEAIMDSKGRLLTSAMVTDRSYAIARYATSGMLDADFGNAMGLLVVDTPNGYKTRLLNVLSLRNGGYVIVLLTADAGASSYDSFVRLIKVDDKGTPVVSFGNNGVLDLRGSQMTSRGIVECPNGDLLFASFGTYVYSHLYQIQPDGSIIPNKYGDFDILPAVALYTLTDHGLLYALSSDSTYKHYVVSRFTVATVTSVDERDHSPLEISIEHGVISVKGATMPVTIRVYSLLGQCVMTKECDPYGSVELPPTVSGAHVVSASSGRDVSSTVVYVAR